jgi:hypothetical protein
MFPAPKLLGLKYDGKLFFAGAIDLTLNRDHLKMGSTSS